jgi:hypothetical protein
VAGEADFTAEAATSAVEDFVVVTLAVVEALVADTSQAAVSTAVGSVGADMS